MKPIPGQALVALLLAFAVSPGAAAVRCHVLPNGLRVVLREDHAFPTVAVNLVVKAGLRSERPEENGISHFLEHMIFKGTKSRGKGQLQLEIEGLGGTLNGGTGRDFTRFYASVGGRFLPQALCVLYDAVANPSLERGEIVLERLVVMDETRARRDDPAASLWELAYQEAYREHPYRRPISGTQQTLAYLTQEALQAYHREHYAARNMSLVLVGDFDTERTLRLVGQIFGGLAPGGASKERVGSEALSGIHRVDTVGRASSEHLLLAFGAPGADNWPEVAPADLLLTILGTGYSSRLHRDLQTRQGVLRSVEVEYLTQRNRGLFGIIASCPPGAADEVMALLLARAAELREQPVPEAELARAKRVLAAGYSFANESFADQADTLGFYEAVGDYQMAIQYPRAIAAATAADLQAVARRYLDPQHYVLVRLHPER